MEGWCWGSLGGVGAYPAQMDSTDNHQECSNKLFKIKIFDSFVHQLFTIPPPLLQKKHCHGYICWLQCPIEIRQFVSQFGPALPDPEPRFPVCSDKLWWHTCFSWPHQQVYFYPGRHNSYCWIVCIKSCMLRGIYGNSDCLLLCVLVFGTAVCFLDLQWDTVFFCIFFFMNWEFCQCS